MWSACSLVAHGPCVALPYIYAAATRRRRCGKSRVGGVDGGSIPQHDAASWRQSVLCK